MTGRLAWLVSNPGTPRLLGVLTALADRGLPADPWRATLLTGLVAGETGDFTVCAYQPDRALAGKANWLITELLFVELVGEIPRGTGQAGVDYRPTPAGVAAADPAAVACATELVGWLPIADEERLYLYGLIHFLRRGYRSWRAVQRRLAEPLGESHAYPADQLQTIYRMVAARTATRAADRVAATPKPHPVRSRP